MSTTRYRWDASVQLNRLYVWIPRSWWPSCFPWTLMLSSVRWEENWSLGSSDWPGSRTQEGGCKEGWGGGRAWMVRDGRGEGRGGVTEQRGRGGKWWRMDWDGGRQRRWRWTERGGDERCGEGGLRQILLRTQGGEVWNRVVQMTEQQLYIRWSDFKGLSEHIGRMHLFTVTELRGCLMYGLYLGLLGFPATLSLCLLLEMCCNDNTNQATHQSCYYAKLTS